MRTVIFILILLSVSIYGYSQTSDPATQKENCLKSISQEKKKELDRIESTYFENNPNPSKYVYLACDNHFPKYRCVKHHKQCAGSCDCLSAYTNQVNYVETSYKQKEDDCEQNYKVAIAKINSQERNLSELSKSEKTLTTSSPNPAIDNKTEVSNTTTEKQQYQTQANNYLNQAKNTNQSAVLRNLNLDLAETNARLAGDINKLEEIRRIRSQENQRSNSEFLNTVNSFTNSLNQLTQNKRLERERHREFVAAMEQQIIQEHLEGFERERNIKDASALGHAYKDSDSKIYWFSIAVGMGHLPSLLYLREEYLRKGDSTTAKELVNFGATKGIPRFIYMAANKYYPNEKLYNDDYLGWKKEFWNFEYGQTVDCEKGLTALNILIAVDTLNVDNVQNTFFNVIKKGNLDAVQDPINFSYYYYYNTHYFAFLKQIYYYIGRITEFCGPGTERENLVEALRRYDQAIKAHKLFMQVRDWNKYKEDKDYRLKYLLFVKGNTEKKIALLDK
ncbi:hypothetical protein [Adhaeribacter rhizoryzae]|uniref:Uncharacterized protein n=1 Tax=Adhaeribacter rhizoryzae TaxID=2607907 RepID=A0A5M6CXB2_9BACT|nr:hypothetical protein [Adhaeribacter rhizoryzae]KAA5539040.1 hypothetical protein F0145_25210 [Adhaeribacter rhizoryzae]